MFGGGAEQSAAATAPSTSVTPATYRGVRFGTNIAFPTRSFSEPQYGGFGGVYVGIRTYSKPSWTSSWSSHPDNTDWYFLSSYGSFDTGDMDQSFPSNWSCPTGYTKGGC